MAKNKTKGAAAKPKVVALSAEEFQKLTPEEQVAHLAKVQDENASLAAEVVATKKGKGKEPLPSFPVDADDDNDIEGGEYEFTCPMFTWDDGKVIDVRSLMADAESEGKKAEVAKNILAKLLQRKSGILRRKED